MGIDRKRTKVEVGAAPSWGGTSESLVCYEERKPPLCLNRSLVLINFNISN